MLFRRKEMKILWICPAVKTLTSGYKSPVCLIFKTKCQCQINFDSITVKICLFHVLQNAHMKYLAHLIFVTTVLKYWNQGIQGVTNHQISNSTWRGFKSNWGKVENGVINCYKSKLRYGTFLDICDHWLLTVNVMSLQGTTVKST